MEKSWKGIWDFYRNVLAELKSRVEDDDDGEPLDIHYELESIQVDEINYAYILTLIQSLIEQGQNQEKEPKRPR